MAEAIDILRKIRKIEIKAKGLSKNLFSGDYHSAFKGQGMSFSENRPYAYGDDTKNIDWNVTARTGEAYIKVFEEERELTVILLIDISKSSFFGTKNSFKSDICAEISGVLAFSAMSNNDKVGAILFSDVIEKYIPPKKGKSHILRILREIVYLNATGKGTDLSAALKYLNNVLKKRSIVFVISDFITTIMKMNSGWLPENMISSVFIFMIYPNKSCRIQVWSRCMTWKTDNNGSSILPYLN